MSIAKANNLGEKIPFDGTDHFAIHYMKRFDHYDMPEYHSHDYFELYYLLSGERRYYIKDKTYLVSKGDLVFINPYDAHKTKATFNPAHERIVIYLRKELLKPDHTLLQDEHSPFQAKDPVVRLPVRGQLFVEELLSKTMTEFLKRNYAFEINIRALLLELLIYILRSNQSQNEEPQIIKNPTHHKISEIVQYINENYANPITLNLLSERFYISQYYLSRVFKETTGLSFTKYLTMVRIKEARKLLRETDRKVSDIIEDVGYHDITHFGKIFKKMTHYSPLQYRRMNRQ